MKILSINGYQYLQDNDFFHVFALSVLVQKNGHKGSPFCGMFAKINGVSEIGISILVALLINGFFGTAAFSQVVSLNFWIFLGAILKFSQMNSGEVL